jgi:CxxC-x17-CxxC domain-containing protein
MEFQDKRLQCVECGKEFIFTAGEQQFFREKRILNEPKRCRPCKLKQLAEMPPQPGSTARRVESAVRCSHCGKETTVPFIPKQGRPVFCRDCYQSKRFGTMA